MNFVISAAFFLFTALCVHAAPSTEEIDDDVARLRTKNALAIFEKIFSEVVKDTPGDTGDALLKSLVKSIDHECIFNQYKKYHYTADLLDEEELKIRITDFPSVQDPQLIRFTVVALSCSNKVEPVLRFIFDIFFAFGELADAFKDDPPFNEAFNDVNCYTDYAITHGFVDAAEYTFLNQTLINQTKEECQLKVDVSMASIKEMISDIGLESPVDKASVECIDNQFYELLKKLTFKYSLLFSAKVTAEQKSREKQNFVKDIKNTIEKTAFCKAISQYVAIGKKV